MSIYQMTCKCNQNIRITCWFVLYRQTLASDILLSSLVSWLRAMTNKGKVGSHTRYVVLSCFPVFHLKSVSVGGGEGGGGG